MERTDHVKYILPTKNSADLIIDNNPENIENNSKLKEIIRLVSSNNKKEFEKFKDQFKKKEKGQKVNLNSYQVYALGFATPIILFVLLQLTLSITNRKKK